MGVGVLPANVVYARLFVCTLLFSVGKWGWGDWAVPSINCNFVMYTFVLTSLVPRLSLSFSTCIDVRANIIAHEKSRERENGTVPTHGHYSCGLTRIQLSGQLLASQVHMQVRIESRPGN